jgi:hypothetical protein
MTDPRSPNDPAGENVGGEPTDTGVEAAARAAAPAPAAAAPGEDSPTQPWPSLTPSAETGPSAASWGPPTSLREPAPSSGPVAAEPAAAEVRSPEPGTDSDSASTQAASPYEPAEHLPDARLGAVGATPAAAAGPDGTRPRSRNRLRWGLALLGIAVVVGASALIVSLAGGRPTPSIALGYMPATTAQYTEVRMDLPGDQRQKLAAFLANFPSFKDQTQLEPKLDEVFDRIVSAASDGKQTWTKDIKPWFGGQIAIGMSVPEPLVQPSASSQPSPELGALTPAMSQANAALLVVTISDRAKAAAWIASLGTDLSRSTYNGADLFTASTPGGTAGALAITDKVIIAGSVDKVKAAVDGNGQGSLAQDADVKAALGQVDRDYVVFGFMKIRAYTDAILKTASTLDPALLDKTQIDETVVSILPTWQASTARFENDALVTSSTYPSLAIGYDATNRKSTLLDHVPAKSVFYAEAHDVGPALTALLAKFRALPETKAAFAQLDQAMSLVGGYDAVAGWWGDAAVVVTPGADGTIGGGLLVKPRDQAAAERLFTTLRGFLALGGSSTGLNVRTEDHNGTTIVILDFSAAPGMASGSLPPGYKPELAYAVNKDVVVIGYGRDFVASVLDTTSTSSLGADARFKGLVGRVGEENIGLSFVDVTAIRGLIEPLAQGTAPADAWTKYQTDVKPYLEHIDAVISAVRKDGSLDRAQAALTAR